MKEINILFHNAYIIFLTFRKQNSKLILGRILLKIVRNYTEQKTNCKNWMLLFIGIIFGNNLIKRDFLEYVINVYSRFPFDCYICLFNFLKCIETMIKKVLRFLSKPF